MCNIWLGISQVNATKHYRFGDDQPYESMYDICERRELYKSLVTEYGRCTGKCYVDVTNAQGISQAKAIGWVFIKRTKYDDCAETFLQETWVSLMTKPPKLHYEYFYL